MVWLQKSKWTTTKKIRVGDKQYDSKFEAGYGQELLFDKTAGKIKDFLIHKTIPLICNGYEIGTYKIDFWVIHNDDSIELVETKGFAFKDWKWRWKVLETMVQTNPKRYFGNSNVRMTLIKQYSNWNMKAIKKFRAMKKL
jgi:hypothetical protein